MGIRLFLSNQQATLVRPSKYLPTLMAKHPLVKPGTFPALFIAGGG